MHSGQQSPSLCPSPLCANISSLKDKCHNSRSERQCGCPHPLSLSLSLSLSLWIILSLSLSRQPSSVSGAIYVKWVSLCMCRLAWKCMRLNAALADAVETKWTEITAGTLQKGRSWGHLSCNWVALKVNRFLFVKMSLTALEPDFTWRDVKSQH